MKQLLFVLLVMCFALTAKAQFLYKKERVPIKTAVPLSAVPVTSKTTIVSLSPSLVALAGTISSVDVTINTEVTLSNNKPQETVDAIGTGSAFVLGTGNNESISTVEILAGHLGRGKRDRLAFGGTVAKSESKETADAKTLLQGGGNFFLSYTCIIFPEKSINDRNYFLFLFRSKLGALLPSAGATSNSIQASLDPGVEFYFSLATLSDEISITASIRSGVLWASKDFSDAIGFKENLVPYNFITGGIKLKSLGTIVYSQSFLLKNLSGITQPKGSIGFSFTL